MTTARTTTPRRLLPVLALALLLIAAAACTSQSAAQTHASAAGCVGPYGWPVKPFDEPHPIRGNFGDPRTVFDGPLSEETLLEGAGTFSFHQGVDISAPDGSPVYSVSSGKVVRARGGRVTVDCGNGRSFQYWHIEATAHVGQKAEAGKTLLGHILPMREHVHLTHLERGRAVNPLAPHRLTPYADRTAPEVVAITATRNRDRVVLVADATDMPTLPVPGRWNGFPVTPALVTWRIEDAQGRAVVPDHVARDVRSAAPANDLFWTTFARGTYQNWPVFAGRKQRGMTGRYFFKLTPTPLDTRQLRDGAYELVVTAEDVAGNKDIRRFRFTVQHDADWR
jgi:Peptidase family M23